MAHEGYFFRSRRGLPSELVEAQQQISAVARGYGLDFCEIVFEMCDYDEINMIAAYGGFPTRYPHWRFGMDYLQMQKGYEYGLQKIYEMVINTVPSYAYLLDNNTFMDQKLVMAHVMGHVDFFTNSAWFAHTNRKMLDQMANHASRVRRIIDRMGESTVETFIDACLSIENLIDPYPPPSRVFPSQAVPSDQTSAEAPLKLPASSYMDRYINPPEYIEAQMQRRAEAREQQQRFPAEPMRDVMLFLLQHGRLASWQADILGIIRDEALYFAPQAQTKIMNEGWASYWHTHLMSHDLLEDSEVIDYADHHSGTVAMRPGSFNPYKVGLELFRHIEERWNKGRFGKRWLETDDIVERRNWDQHTGLGRQKLFEVRRTHNDITFIDEFLTEDFVREQGLFTQKYNSKAGHFEVDSREFLAVKNQLLSMLSNRGNPRITVTDGNHANRGELELTHAHEGTDLQLDWAEPTLRNLAHLWGRPVHLVTQVQHSRAVLSHDGSTFSTEGIRPQTKARP